MTTFFSKLRRKNIFNSSEKLKPYSLFTRVRISDNFVYQNPSADSRKQGEKRTALFTSSCSVGDGAVVGFA